eukprot:scaffold45401_cov53-Attheya_sp.AAC.5
MSREMSHAGSYSYDSISKHRGERRHEHFAMPHNTRDHGKYPDIYLIEFATRVRATTLTTTLFPPL